MKNFILISIVITAFSSCGEKASQIETTKLNTEKNMDTIVRNDSLKNLLERQIMSGFALKESGLDASSDYKYSSEDFQIASKLSKDILLKNGFKFLDEKSFQSKVKNIFGFLFEDTYISNFLIEYPCSRNKIAYQLDENYVISNNSPLFIDYKSKIITEAYFIPELINYKKDFPDIFKKEKDIAKVKNVDINNQMEIIPWMFLTSLDEKRQLNIEKIINRNKYLFNDSKASLAWLKFNDKVFLESLVKTFGYTSDSNLLNFVVKNNYKDKENLKRILWNESCDAKIKVNKEVFDNVKYWDEQETQVFINKTLDVQVDSYKALTEDKSVNFSKQTKIMALVAYYATKTNRDFYYRFFPLLNEPRFEEEFKKNNYYDIGDFHEVFEDTRYGGIGPAE